MNVEELMSEFARSHERVTAQVAALQNNPRLATQVRRLEEMERSISREMSSLASTTREHAPGAVREMAESGFRVGAQQAGAGVVTDFSMINREAVEGFASGMTDDLLRATDGVTQSTRDLVRSTARNEGLRSMIEGGTAQDAGRAMQDHLQANGIFAVRYADGSRHGLGEYSQMAMRTTTAQAYNTSLIDGAQAEGTEFFEIFDGPDCGLEFHDDTTLAAGMIVSGSAATSFPIAHPNCRRGFGARPDIKTQAEADAGTPHVTEEQMAAQRAADESGLTAAQQARIARREGSRGASRGAPRTHLTRDHRIEQYRQRVKPTNLGQEAFGRGSTEEFYKKAAGETAARFRGDPADLRELMAEQSDHWLSVPDDEIVGRATESIITRWGGSSGGPVPEAMISHVAERVGIAYSPEALGRGAAYIRSNPAMDRATRALGDAMYDSTQSWFAKNGYTHVTAYRTGAIKDRLFTSWSTSAAGGTRGVAEHVARVPVERVFSTWGTGFGTKAETEIVLLGTIRAARAS